MVTEDILGATKALPLLAWNVLRLEFTTAVVDFRTKAEWLFARSSKQSAFAKNVMKIEVQTY